jgi:N-acetylmuramoyl-L-alanine amidase
MRHKRPAAPFGFFDAFLACRPMTVLRTLFAAFLIGLIAHPAGSAAQLASVTGVRLGQNGPVTRVVVETSAAATGKAFTLTGPDRVVIDLPASGWAGRGSPTGRGIGLAAAYHVAPAGSGHVRVTIDLAAPAVIRKSFSVPPNGSAPDRFVVDIEAAASQTVAAAQVSPKSTGRVPTKVGIPVPPKRPDVRRVVVIDAGHGGQDPGTIGASGTYEKTVTLEMAREVKKVMEASGRYRVVLTRADDTFIRLRDRVALARAAGAELFISLHADSIGDHRHRGASVYTLSEVASDKEAEALATKENKADLIAGIDLSNENRDVANILIDLAQRETMNYSARFAATLVHEIDRAAKINVNPHRFAGFAVLKAPDVPSVLIEMGYLSNRQDERMLRDSHQRKRFAEAIRRAADRFFAEKKS